jgi:hypothetical protein
MDEHRVASAGLLPTYDQIGQSQVQSLVEGCLIPQVGISERGGDAGGPAHDCADLVARHPGRSIAGRAEDGLRIQTLGSGGFDPLADILDVCASVDCGLLALHLALAVADGLPGLEDGLLFGAEILLGSGRGVDGFVDPACVELASNPSVEGRN